LNSFYEIATLLEGARNDRKYSPPHPNPLPPRGEGMRREIFTLLLSKSKKEVILLHFNEKKLKYFSSLLK